MPFGVGGVVAGWPVRVVKWITRLFDNREMPVYIFKIRRSPTAHPWALPLHPGVRVPLLGGMKGELEEEQWLVCVWVAQSDRGPGTAHIVFWPLGSPQRPPPPPLMDAGPRGSQYTHALSALWRSSRGQRKAWGRREGELAEDVNHSFTGHHAILTWMVNTEMPLKDLAGSRAYLCGVQWNPHMHTYSVYYFCIHIILYIFKNISSTFLAIRKLRLAWHCVLNESNQSKWTPTITLSPVLAQPEVLAHLCSGQQCLGQGLWSLSSSPSTSHCGWWHFCLASSLSPLAFQWFPGEADGWALFMKLLPPQWSIKPGSLWSAAGCQVFSLFHAIGWRNHTYSLFVLTTHGHTWPHRWSSTAL